MKKTNVIYLVCLLLLVTIAWLSTTFGGSASGIVLDADTREPIAGAYVLIQWDGRVFGWGGNSQWCIHQDVAKTDSRGRFQVGPWIRLRTDQEFGLLEGLKESSIEQSGVIYKAGYAFRRFYPGDQEHGKYDMRRFQGAPAEHARELAGTPWGSCRDPSEKKALPVLEAVLDEVKGLPGGGTARVGPGTIVEYLQKKICYEQVANSENIVGVQERAQCEK